MSILFLVVLRYNIPMDETSLIQTLIGSALVGTVVSVLGEFIKNKLGLNSNKAKVFILVVSVTLAGAVFFLKNTPYWIPLLTILGSASSVYNFVIKGSTMSGWGKQEEELG